MGHLVLQNPLLTTTEVGAGDKGSRRVTTCITEEAVLANKQVMIPAKPEVITRER